jgi:hypothetical protein
LRKPEDNDIEEDILAQQEANWFDLFRPSRNFYLIILI